MKQTVRGIAAAAAILVAGCQDDVAQGPPAPPLPPAPIDMVGEFSVASVLFSPDAGVSQVDGPGWLLSDGSGGALAWAGLPEASPCTGRIFELEPTGIVLVREPCTGRLWQGSASSTQSPNAEFSLPDFTAQLASEPDAQGRADPGLYDAGRSEFPLTLQNFAGTYAPRAAGSAASHDGAMFIVTVDVAGAFTIFQPHCQPRAGSVSIPDAGGKGIASVSGVPELGSDGSGPCGSGNGQPFHGLLAYDGTMLRIILVQEGGAAFYAGELARFGN